MLKEIVEALPDDAVSIHVVWLPMLPGDSREAALATGAMFAGRPVHQYYDARRVVGLAYSRDVFPTCLRDVIRATPEDHPFHAVLAEWAEHRRDEGPLWDAVLFYPAGVEWQDKAPAPALWSKQVAFFVPSADGIGAVCRSGAADDASDGDDAGGSGEQITGTFFHNDCNQPPVDSDWFLEVRRAIVELQAGASDH